MNMAYALAIGFVERVKYGGRFSCKFFTLTFSTGSTIEITCRRSDVLLEHRIETTSEVVSILIGYVRGTSEIGFETLKPH